MSIPPMTLRRWMVLATVVAFGLWGVRTWSSLRQRYAYCQTKALQCGDLERWYLGATKRFDRAAELRRWKVDQSKVEGMEATAHKSMDESDRWALLRRRYERAAMVPWSAIPPDPHRIWLGDLEHSDVY